MDCSVDICAQAGVFAITLRAVIQEESQPLLLRRGSSATPALCLSGAASLARADSSFARHALDQLSSQGDSHSWLCVRPSFAGFTRQLCVPICGTQNESSMPADLCLT